MSRKSGHFLKRPFIYESQASSISEKVAYYLSRKSIEFLERVLIFLGFGPILEASGLVFGVSGLVFGVFGLIF